MTRRTDVLLPDGEESMHTARWAYRRFRLVAALRSKWLSRPSVEKVPATCEVPALAWDTMTTSCAAHVTCSARIYD